MTGNVFKACLIALVLALFSNAASAAEINLSVAASLKEVVNELALGFAAKNRGVKIVKNYGGSGQLAKQIENGAPADIFISANMEWLDYLKTRKLVDNSSIATFSYNALVFAGAADKKVSGMKDLVKLERIAIGSPKSVPAGEYASEAMQKAGVDKVLQKRLVMTKDVRECLMYAERGEVDGAFVYRTDALQARQAKILFTVPQELYPRVVYPMALTAAGARNKDAGAFYKYLQSGDAQAVLRKYGFALK